VLTSIGFHFRLRFSHSALRIFGIGNRELPFFLSNMEGCVNFRVLFYPCSNLVFLFFLVFFLTRAGSFPFLLRPRVGLILWDLCGNTSGEKKYEKSISLRNEWYVLLYVMIRMNDTWSIWRDLDYHTAWLIRRSKRLPLLFAHCFFLKSSTNLMFMFPEAPVSTNL